MNNIQEIIANENKMLKPSGKFFDNVKLKFDKEFLYLTADGEDYRVKLKDCSVKLYNAKTKERLDYRISPNGYGISWAGLDEDLSVKGLIQVGSKVSDNSHKRLKPQPSEKV